MPKINWGNPITKGLVFDAPFSEGAGVIAEDDAAPLGLDLVGTIVSSGATWVRTPFGNALDFSAAASSVSYTTPSILNTMTVFSIEFLALYRSEGGGAAGRIIHKVSGSPSRYQINVGHTTTNQFSFNVNYDTTSGFWDVNNFFPANVWSHGVLTYDGSSVSNVPNVYRNGLLQTLVNVTQPVGTWVSDDTNLYIGNRSDGLRNWDGKISYLRIWNRILTATEARSLYTNPWQIYQKPNFTPYYISPAVVGGSSIKTINGLSKASVKTINGLAIASAKTWNGLT
jgi:hypothetical protein